VSPPSPQTFCLEAEAPDRGTAERVAAEAWAAGALGVEEREGSVGRTLLLVYVPGGRVKEVQEAIAALPGVAPGPAAPVVPTDWSQAWRQGLEPVLVGERLVVRPSWIPVDLGPQQVEIVLDPGQAFGTGGHVSTRLALEWIEAVAREEEAFCATTRVLDVGAGTGVLALSALRLGVGRALAGLLASISIHSPQRARVRPRNVTASPIGSRASSVRSPSSPERRSTGCSRTC